MKCVAFSLFLVAATTVQTTEALKKYLDNLPNGASFKQALGHPDSDDSKFTDFATAFLGAEKTWTPAFCKAMFPGASMTNGEAFGDPCCTWKKGDTPSSTVTAFTDKPTTKTVCASAAAPAAATTPAPAATTAKPAAAATTPAPAATTAKPAAAAMTPAAATTPAPAATTSAPAAATTTAPAAAGTKPGGKPGKPGNLLPGSMLPGKGKGCVIKPKAGKVGKSGGMRGSAPSPAPNTGSAKQTSY